MQCSVYIATSADGYIATPDGQVDWLHSAGNAAADMGADADMGFNDFLSSVDCMIMGRKCMQMIASMNLTPEQWPYGDLPIIVLSHSLTQAPDNLLGKVEMYAGSLSDLITNLEQRGLQHAYIDGGTTITAFLNEQLINAITITRAPVLLGAGLPLFGKLHTAIALQSSEAKAFANDFIQIHYQVKYN